MDLRMINHNGLVIDPEYDYVYTELCGGPLRTYSGPLDVVVDIGAHYGVFSLLAVAEGAQRVYAFEPFCYDNLVQNISRNQLWDKVFPLGLGVADRAGLMPFSRYASRGQHSFMFHPNYPAGLHPCVALRDIPTIIGSHIDYLKVDIEGGEFNLFSPDCQEALSRVYFLDLELHSVDNEEYHPRAEVTRYSHYTYGRQREELLAFLRGQGFKDLKDNGKNVSSRNYSFAGE